MCWTATLSRHCTWKLRSSTSSSWTSRIVWSCCEQRNNRSITTLYVLIASKLTLNLTRSRTRTLFAPSVAPTLVVVKNVHNNSTYYTNQSAIVWRNLRWSKTYLMIKLKNYSTLRTNRHTPMSIFHNLKLIIILNKKNNGWNKLNN